MNWIINSFSKITNLTWVLIVTICFCNESCKNERNNLNTTTISQNEGEDNEELEIYNADIFIK